MSYYFDDAVANTRITGVKSAPAATDHRTVWFAIKRDGAQGNTGDHIFVTQKSGGPIRTYASFNPGSGDSIRVYNANDGTNSVSIADQGLIPDQTWVFVVCEIDATTLQNRILAGRIGVDATCDEVASYSSQTTGTGTPRANDVEYAVGNSIGVDAGMKGWLTHVGMAHRKLTTQEVATLYAGASAPTDLTNVVLALPLVNDLNDVSGNGNHGTASGGVSQSNDDPWAVSLDAVGSVEEVVGAAGLAIPRRVDVSGDVAEVSGVAGLVADRPAAPYARVWDGSQWLLWRIRRWDGSTWV